MCERPKTWNGTKAARGTLVTPGLRNVTRPSFFVPLRFDLNI